MYAIVIDYNVKTGSCTYVSMDDDLNTIISSPKTCANLQELAMDCLKYKIKPYNFSLSRSGEINQDAGAFSRLNPKSAIVLAEYVNKVGKKQGYKLLFVTGKIVNKRLQDILSCDKTLGEATPFLQNAIIRNDTVNCYSNHNFKQLVIGTDTDTKLSDIRATQPIKAVGSLSDVTISTQKYDKNKIIAGTERQFKIDVDLEEHSVTFDILLEPLLSFIKDKASTMKENNNVAEVARLFGNIAHWFLTTENEPEDGKKFCVAAIDTLQDFAGTLMQDSAFLDACPEWLDFVSVQAEIIAANWEDLVGASDDDTHKNTSTEYTKQQKREIKACRDKGLDSGFIENPTLSANQMRVLWVSKAKGMKAEYYNNPQMSVDVMKFYAEKIDSDQAADMCLPILEHPEYSLEKVKLLYDCIVRGLDIKDFADETVDNIEIKQMEAEAKQWGYAIPEKTEAENSLADAKVLEEYYRNEQIKNMTPEEVQAQYDLFMASYSKTKNVDAVRKAKADYLEAHPEADPNGFYQVAINSDGTYKVTPVKETEKTKAIDKAIKKYNKEHPDEDRTGKLLSIQAKTKKNKNTGELKTVYEISYVDGTQANLDMTGA